MDRDELLRSANDRRYAAENRGDMLISEQSFKEQYVYPFDAVQYLYKPELGFIVWRFGTGENVELLHVRSAEPRQGQGRQLVYRMLDYLRATPPYYSVFGFTRVSNTRAIQFYESLGFCTQTIQGLYADGQASIFWQDYRELLRLKSEYENSLHRETRQSTAEQRR